MKKIFLSLLFSLTIAFFVSAPIVFGAGLVQCDEANPSSCSLCSLFATVKAIYDFVTQFTIILAVAFIMFGGYQMMISGSNPALYKSGKGHIYQALMGLAIVLSAWFLVDILMRGLSGSGDIYGVPWRSIQCK